MWKEIWASQVVLVVKNSPAHAGDIRDAGYIPESGRSPGIGNGNPLQYSCLENPMDSGACRATVHRVAKNHIWFKQLSIHAESYLSQPTKYIYIHTDLQSVQSLSCVQISATPWTAPCQASLSITNSWSLLKLMSIESVMPSNHLILCSPFSSCRQSFPASGTFPMNQFFTSGGQSIGVSASTSVLPMNIQDWFPLGWIMAANL